MKDISLYIHIPFCDSKCYYCDFVSFVGREDLVEPYIEALKKEIDFYKDRLLDYRVRTIFIGGGTPSSIDPKYIYEILEYIFVRFDTSYIEEITMESNPGNISKEKIFIYKKAGINRISMGAQTFNNDLLKYIGRIHKEKDIYKSVEYLRSGGIENINLDLMFGLPNQTFEMGIDSVKKATELDVKHISNYGLMLEGNTPMHKSYMNGEIELMDVELDRNLYHRTREILKESGYNHYEISNFAKMGFKSLHNLAYWEINPYLGLGLGSHSNLEGRRFSNTVNILEYLEKISFNKKPIDSIEIIDKEEEISEYCIMGFRKIKGINRLDFKKRFEIDFEDKYEFEIGKNIKNGLLVWNGDHLSLTEKGLDLSNQVELDFFRQDS